jgi:hypothetical protein
MTDAGIANADWSILPSTSNTTAVFRIYNRGAATECLNITPAGAATFLSSVTSTQLLAGASSSTRIYFDADIAQGFYSTESTSRWSLGRDVFVSGQTGLAIGRTSKWSMIGENGLGTALYFSVGVTALGTGGSFIKMSIDNSGHVTPGANGTQNFGSASLRWGTVYTSDLSLSNGIGDYTIVEGEEDLFLYNNKKNKVYKFLLSEVDPSEATPKKS